MKKILIIAMAIAMLGCGNQSSQSSQDTQSNENTPGTPTEEYTLDENIGMMLLVGFRGTELDYDKNIEIISAIRDYHVGSVILFDYDVPTGTRGRNIKDAEQLKRLCKQLRAFNDELIIGIDQEGGYVSRLSKRYGFPAIPSAKRLAAMGDDSLRHYADLTGQMLQELGIDLDFAPVADVDINPRCPVIGGIERSFSANADRVRQCCIIWGEEMAKHNVISCMKHFPGHGSSTGDTHKGLVDVTSTWKRCELNPYRNLDKEWYPCPPLMVPTIGMVMTAHVINRQLDPSGLPASLSPKITSYLRDTLGFKGIIVTDDLAMGAIAGQYGFEEAIRMAVMAGADLLCLSNNGSHYDVNMVPRAVRVIKKMVEDGEVSEERIQQSANRIRDPYQFEL